MFRRISAVRLIRAGRPSPTSTPSGSTPSDTKKSDPAFTTDKQKADLDRATDNLLQKRKILLGIADYTGFNWPIQLGLWYVKRLQNKRATGEAVMAQPKRWLKTFGYFMILCCVAYGFWWLIFEYDVDKQTRKEKKK